MNKRNHVIALAAILTITSLTPIKAFAAEDLEVKEKTEAPETVMALSLDKAIEYALKNSMDIKIQEVELQKADVAYDEGIRDVKKAENNIDEMFTRDPMTGMSVPDAAINRTLIENGASRRGVKLAYDLAKWNKELKINEIKYNVEKAYFDLLQAEKELEIAKENLALSQKQLEHGKLRFELGLISKQQLLGLEMGLSQAQAGVDSAKMFYDLQLMSFQDTLGLPFNKLVDLTDSIVYKKHEEINLDTAIKQGLENNVNIKAAKESFEVSKLKLAATKVRYPENTYRYREQEAEVAKAEKNYEVAKNGVEMSVRSAVLNLLTAEKQITIYEKTIEQAEQALKIAETSFDLGKNTSTDVHQANINLMNAKKELSKQIHAYNLALLDYESSIGIGK